MVSGAARESDLVVAVCGIMRGFGNSLAGAGYRNRLEVGE